MFVRKGSNTIWLLFLLVLSGSHAFSNCDNDLSKLSSESSTADAPVFAPWKIDAQNLTLTPQHLLPKEFIEEVESKVGPLRVLVDFKTPGKNQIVIRANDRTYMKAALFTVESNPNTVLVDNLTLQDPLKEDVKSGLNLDQSGKGLPPAVFKYVNKRLIELLKAGGYSHMMTDSQQHFGVLMLYQRLVGMSPENEDVQKRVNEIEALYQFARKELPLELRPKSVEDFSALLGTAATSASGYTFGRNAILQKYFETGVLPENVEIVKNKEGKIVCALFHSESQLSKPNILFIHYLNGSPTVFHWADIARSRKIKLIKRLD